MWNYNGRDKVSQSREGELTPKKQTRNLRKKTIILNLRWVNEQNDEYAVEEES